MEFISKIILEGEKELNKMKRGGPREIGIPDMDKKQCIFFFKELRGPIKENVRN